MSPPDTEDVILRECKRTLLARRLILHGVRTNIITQLTGMTRGRLNTLRRRRLMIPGKARYRGTAKSALTVFLSEPLARAEGAAIATLFTVFEIPIERKAVRRATVRDVRGLLRLLPEDEGAVGGDHRSSRDAGAWGPHPTRKMPRLHVPPRDRSL